MVIQHLYVLIDFPLFLLWRITEGNIRWMFVCIYTNSISRKICITVDGFRSDRSHISGIVRSSIRSCWIFFKFWYHPSWFAPSKQVTFQLVYFVRWIKKAVCIMICVSSKFRWGVRLTVLVVIPYPGFISTSLALIVLKFGLVDLTNVELIPVWELDTRLGFHVSLKDFSMLAIVTWR